jgi:glutamyl-tRNA synthetase
LRLLAERLGFGDNAGRVFQPLRVALTGLAASPGIFDVLVVLGRDRALARIDDAVAFLRRLPGASAA